MTVKELIEKLQELPDEYQDAIVSCYTHINDSIEVRANQIRKYGKVDKFVVWFKPK